MRMSKDLFFSLNEPVIVLPEVEDERILSAASLVLTKKIANIILIGNKTEILTRAQDKILEHATFINPVDFAMLDIFSEKLSHFGLPSINNLDQAKAALLQNPLYFGMMLVKEAFADGIVAGAVYSSMDVLHPALTIFKMAKNMETIFSYMVITIPADAKDNQKRLIFADCALNTTLEAEERAEVAKCSGDIYAHITNQQPIIKMLSGLNMNGFQMEIDAETLNAIAIFEERYPDMKLVKDTIDGEKIRGEQSQEANVYIFPNIASGNIGYKLVQYLCQGRAAGPFIKGLRKPLSDLSRGCSITDVIDTITLLSNEIKAEIK